LDPPRDGDRSSGEDGMIAEVIPLRRRRRDRGWPASEVQSPHSGVFDPPPDPEPPEEYSVWERPTSELVRRQPPDHLIPVDERRRRWSLRSLTCGPQVAAGMAALIAAAALIIATVGLHGGPRTSASTDVGSTETGLGAQLGGPPRSSQPSHARHVAHGSRPPAPTRPTIAHRSAGGPTISRAAVAAAPAERSAGAGTYVPQQTATGHPATQASGGEAPTATTASHEFSFEQ
jgi:hypothetical protein